VKNYADVKLKEGNIQSSERQEATPLLQGHQINTDKGGQRGKKRKHPKKQEPNKI